ncbi:MAG: type I 3-dehydroquinate dehydratase [Bacteroidales bacterium]|nr:type I 3-dehydroquinate dehydratase [Bacteroidales bacterium]
MICVSVQEKSLKGCLEALKNAPMAELRADLCKLTLHELEKVVESHPNLLITCRIANSSIEFAKEQIITAIRKGAKYVDVEIEAPVDFLEYVKTYAQVNGAKVIVSYHNFDGTQSIEELELIADICKRKGADIVKIVTTAHTISDAVRTLSLYKRGNWAKEFKTNNYSEQKDVMLLAFSMGKAGQFSRYVSLKMGAPYTYVSLPDAATAPGQYTIVQMEELLAKGDLALDYSFSKSFTSIPCSKSVAQRAILAAAFAKGTTRLSNYEPCNDITGALRVIEQFGCKVKEVEEGTIEIVSGGVAAIKENFVKSLKTGGDSSRFEIYTGESGLLTRLLIPFAGYLTDSACRESEISGGDVTINIAGSGSILGRNMESAAAAVRATGAECSTSIKSGSEGYLPFEIKGRITQPHIKVSGRESSQTISGLLMMLPLLPYDTTLLVENPASIPYIELTVDVLKEFGISLQKTVLEDGNLLFAISGGQNYQTADLYLEPDWSSAAFFAVGYALASMKEHVQYCIKDMKIGTSQADEAVLAVLESAGVNVNVKLSGSKEGLYDIIIEGDKGLKAFEFDATNAPDLFPILATLAMFCEGCSSIKGVGRLLEKESNRAESIYTEFTAIGADIEIVGDYMYINGNMKVGEPDRGTLCEEEISNLHSHNDHRIAMSLIIASMFINGSMFLDDIKCIDKSFPSFLRRL